jgi:hypothetical protein
VGCLMQSFFSAFQIPLHVEVIWFIACPRIFV